jgi:hypothetical protein
MDVVDSGRQERPFTLVWNISERVLSVRCECGARFEAGEPVPVLDWLDEHPHNL